MNKDILNQLATEQEKIHLIHKLSNYIQKVNSHSKNDIAYLIHRIIEEPLTLDIRREVTSYAILANRELFMNALDTTVKIEL